MPTIDLDVMSVALRGVGDDPMIQYSDPIKLFTHLNEVHGAEAVNGMAGLMAWAMAPTRALGRFDAGAPPKTLDEMYACATNEFERSAIDDMLFGSVTDVLDRYLPDREKHGALRGSMTVLAVNTLYRGPATPGSAAALAFGLGVPDGDTMQMKKLRGGIGALTSHLVDVLERDGGEVRLRTKVTEILVSDGQVGGVRTEAGDTVTAPIVISALAPDLTVNDLLDPAALPADIRERYARIDHRGSYIQMHFALDEAPEFVAPVRDAQRPEHAGVDRHLQHAGRSAAAVGGLQAWNRAGRPDRRLPGSLAERPRPRAAPASMRRRRSRCGSRSRATSTTARRRSRWGSG